MRARARGRARRGFTLIELLVVVVIIGILASIALPSFVSAQDKARNASVIANLNVLRVALENYCGDHGGSPPSVTTLKQPRKRGKRRKGNTTQVTVNDNDFMDGEYLPNNELPQSPWCVDSQDDLITNASQYDDLPSAKAVDDGADLPKQGQRFNPLLKGAVASEPTLVTHYGALSYDSSTGTTGNYVAYGTGKRNQEAIVAGAISRHGGNGGQ
jgi:type II secretion system protein G